MPKSKSRKKKHSGCPHPQQQRKVIGRGWDCVKTGDVSLTWRCKVCGVLKTTVVDNWGVFPREGYKPSITRTSTGHVYGVGGDIH